MPFIPPNELAELKQIDLLTYLQSYEPEELVRISANEFSTKTHSSLKISNGMWRWHAQDIGGKSALDFLIKVRGMDFMAAANLIQQQAALQPPVFCCPAMPAREFVLPKAAPNNDHVLAYLQSRGIDKTVLEHCVTSKMLYESAEHYNCVLVGKDAAGQARYAALRGTYGDYKGEARGSDKSFAFTLPAAGSTHLRVCESAIDVLSCATLLGMKGRDWQQSHVLSLGGTSMAALERYLKDYPHIQRIDLHLDNDPAGRVAAQAIAALLGDRYDVRNRSPPHAKDMNAYLMARLGLTQRKKVRDVCTR
ncbi:MAG: DUF3991 and toprim domain-containing protein [Oscillospiraceae bacterium]|jgi:hypothetical protein|nr:DUF3991 and toprim domain-containing protein [Oscillospiraceae bacterium]